MTKTAMKKNHYESKRNISRLKRLKVEAVLLQQKKKNKLTSVPICGRAGYNKRKRKGVKNEQ